MFGDRQPGGNSFPTGLINVPDIAVVAKDIKTGTTSSPTKTNPQGYFRTPSLAPGEYQICVSGGGYVTGCDPQVIVVTNSIRVLDHTVPIRPTPRALFGNHRSHQHGEPHQDKSPSATSDPPTAIAASAGTSRSVITCSSRSYAAS